MKKYILLLMMTFITKGFAQQKTSANPIFIHLNFLINQNLKSFKRVIDRRVH